VFGDAVRIPDNKRYFRMTCKLRIGKDYFVAYSRHYAGIYMSKPSKLTKTTSSTRCTTRDSKQIHTESESVALRLHQHARCWDVL